MFRVFSDKNFVIFHFVLALNIAFSITLISQS